MKANDVGTQYFAVVSPSPNTTLSKVGGKVALTDLSGKDNWCAPPSATPQTLVQQACSKGKFGSTVTCSQVSALIANESTNLGTWESDLANGKNLCALGTILGPGVPMINPTTKNPDTLYTCLYTNAPPRPCDSSAQANNPDPPGAGGFSNYIAMARGDGGPSAKVVSDEDSSKNGLLNLSPGTRAFSFDVDGATMYISSLNLPVSSFSFNDQWFTLGQASAVNVPQGNVSSTNSSVYTIPSGSAKFSLIALDQSGAGYAFTATNSTPITLDISSSTGPQITGTIQGNLEGHSLHADVTASMAWLNRPPVAMIQASNVRFNSSRWSGARDVSAVCMTQNGLKGWTWHGVPDAKVTVTLDGSSSYDPDAGDSLQYSWSGKAVGTQKIVYLQVGAGDYQAFLTVQDQYYVSTVNTVKFSVRDLANPGAPSDCGGQNVLRDPAGAIRYRYQGDPAPFWAVARSYATSEGPGVPVNFHTRQQVMRMAEPLSRLRMGDAIYKQAVSPNLGMAIKTQTTSANSISKSPHQGPG